MQAGKCEAEFGSVELNNARPLRDQLWQLSVRWWLVIYYYHLKSEN